MEPSNILPERVCPECGAKVVEGMSCWEQLGMIIAWEYNDPELQAEHFLTVAAYNLQHPAQFTDEAIAGLRTAFMERLEKNISLTWIRRRTARANEGSKRVRRPESERQIRQRHWHMTIADVYLPNQPQGAAGRVRAWAVAIRNEIALDTTL